MYACRWAGSLSSSLWHHTRPGEGPHCFSLYCHPSRQLGEVKDCVIQWSVLLSETSTSVMKLTSPHCLSLELHDAQRVTEDGRWGNPEITANACVVNDQSLLFIRPGLKRRHLNTAERAFVLFWCQICYPVSTYVYAVHSRLKRKMRMWELTWVDCWLT